MKRGSAMCGIAGFCSFNADYIMQEGRWTDVLVKMRESLKRRGNDDCGEYLCRHTGLSQTRLSIRDIENGRQPIIRTVNDNTYIIVYNGEIYNTNELKAELKKDFEFATTSDTEVILYCFIKYGMECVNMLNGIFAFAIWDSAAESLYLFRDQSGVKPLFYSFCNDTLVFGSEIKALFEFPGIEPQLDINGMREVIGIGPARTAGNGVFKGIYEIKPAHYAVYSPNGFKQKRYWQLESRCFEQSYKETLEQLRALIVDAVERQLVSDVPICSFLSGGVDSSIVTAIANNYLKQHSTTLNTFSFDFSENDTYFKSNSFQAERDRPYVDIMLKYHDLNHKYLECNESDLADYLYMAVDAKDIPGMADVDASLLYFCREVKKYNKVTLTGECADEIFGGYPWFHRKELFNSGTFPWTIDLQPRKQLLRDDFIHELDIDTYVSERYEESISQTPLLDGENEEQAARRRVSYLNLNWFMTTLLERMDRTSMYSGLEARVPFADYRIIEYVWNIPWEYKCRNGVVKGLLREACQDLLPPELINRKKSPYPKTYNPKYEKLLIERLLEVVFDNNSAIQPIIDKQKVLDFIHTPSDYGKPWFGQLMCGPQLMAYMLQINYWLDKFKLSI